MNFFGQNAIFWDSMKRLAELRRKKGFSQRDLAKISKVGHVTIARIETNACNPRLSTLQALAKALKVSVREFFD